MTDYNTYKKTRRIRQELELLVEVQKTKDDFIKQKDNLSKENIKYHNLNLSIKMANKFHINPDGIQNLEIFKMGLNTSRIPTKLDMIKRKRSRNIL
jgi:hypothetical protein